MRQRLKGSRGQFMPIAAMVVFTTVVFIVAVINVYKVAKVKLRMQNIADAIALEIASREASSLNFLADRDEWMNRLYTDPLKNTDPASGMRGCPQDLATNTTRIPGISCIQFLSASKSFSFPSITGAQGYARLVQSVNESQRLAMNAYDTFLGAENGNGVGKKALQSILLNDIADLKNDPSIRVITYNTDDHAKQAMNELKNAQTNPSSFFGSNQSRVDAKMEPLGKSLKFQNVTVAYDGKGKLLGTVKHAAFQKTFKQLLGSSEDIGWVAIDQNALPKMKVAGAHGSTGSRIAAGAIVIKPVEVLGITFAVSARALAYVVPGSGDIPVVGTGGGTVAMPTFSPTFWVKLVNEHE